MSAWTKEKFDELVAVIADGDPGVWMRLRADHVAGPDGHCPACRSSNGTAPIWPCTLRTIADEAARIAPQPAPNPTLTAAIRTQKARRRTVKYGKPLVQTGRRNPAHPAHATGR